MSDFDVANVEFELERMQTEQTETNGCGGCGCFNLKFFILFVVGLVLIRLILELFNIYV